MAKEVYKGEMESLVREGAMLVDVREADDYEDGDGLPGGTHLPLSRIAELTSSVHEGRPIIFYCRSGLLSFQAAEIAAALTERPTYYLSGGLLGYADA
jgi:rhodanese-related sulfurtransferase